MQRNSTIWKSVAVLSSGTVLAQGINLLLTPILTRIYSAEEMGELGLYMQLVGFLSVISTLRYELAIPLPESGQKAFQMYRVAMRQTFVILTGALVLGIVYFISISTARFLLPIYGLALLGGLFITWFNIGSNWAIRNGEFKQISMAKIQGAIAGGGLKWLLGVLGFGALGLLFGALLGQLAMSIGFIRQFFKKRNQFEPLDEKGVKALKRTYRDFPSVSFPHALIDVARDLAIAIGVAALYSKSIYGYYNHALVMLKVPLVVIGSAIGQVFYNKCTQMIRENQSIYEFLRKTLTQLLLVAVIPFTAIFLWGDEVFGIVFGEDWEISGEMAMVMSLWMAMNFVNSPLSSIPMILNRQREYFFLGLGSTSIQLIGFFFLPLYFGYDLKGFQSILWVISLCMAGYFAFQSVLTLQYAKKGPIQRG